jgi:hypothetical protein
VVFVFDDIFFYYRLNYLQSLCGTNSTFIDINKLKIELDDFLLTGNCIINLPLFPVVMGHAYFRQLGLEFH